MKINPVKLNWTDAHELMVCMVQPRPIALVSTIGPSGVFNVAPFSFYNGISVKPMLVGFNTAYTREGKKKDTLVNVEYASDFVINGVPEELAEAMNKTSEAFPPDISEFIVAGLTPIKADLVKAPMVGESPLSMECRLIQILIFGTERHSAFIIGEVLRVHIKDELYRDKEVPVATWRAIGRMGGHKYCRTTDAFEMKIPASFL